MLVEKEHLCDKQTHFSFGKHGDYDRNFDRKFSYCDKKMVGRHKKIDGKCKIYYNLSICRHTPFTFRTLKIWI